MTIKTGSDFSGVGAFDQALSRLGIVQEKMFACDMDKYARQTYILNYGEPKYYPENVYDREIPSDSLDIYMTSPPCQSFSLAGKRKGEDSTNGVLFYNSHEFITVNKPRYFIFENVKGLLSDDGGKTFQRWIDYLGGKTVNGNPVIFPHEKSVPYHVYYQVMNAKHYGVPQNRERIFIIGIRDDADNEFSFPKPFHLVKRLKDVLESEVDEKYFLSDKMLSYFDSRAANFNNGNINFKDEESIASTITSSSKSLDISDNILKLGYINQDTQASQVFSEDGTSPNICAGTHGYANGYVQIPANNSKGYDIAEEEEEDSINFSNPNSETRRGRVGHGVAQTLDTACNQGVLVSQLNPSLESGGKQPYQQNRIYDINGINPALNAGQSNWGGNIINSQRIRRLTPRECANLMDFPETMKFDVSDSQIYKQMGNSIVVGVLALIIEKLKL